MNTEQPTLIYFLHHPIPVEVNKATEVATSMIEEALKYGGIQVFTVNEEAVEDYKTAIVDCKFNSTITQEPFIMGNVFLVSNRKDWDTIKRAYHMVVYSRASRLARYDNQL